MNEKPILFSAPMVRAILAGNKSQTRRVMKPQPEHRQIHACKGKILYEAGARMWCWKDKRGADNWDNITTQLGPYCPYGKAGDGLWVKETFCPVEVDGKIEVAYRASTDADGERCREELGYKWKPSIFMHRCESRINLEITNIRVEKLQDISEEDARAEGATLRGMPRYEGEARDEFRMLWNSINAKPTPVIDRATKKVIYYVSYPWENIQETRTYRGKPWYVKGNPYCWCLSFKKV